MNNIKEEFTVGQVSKICHVSKKTVVNWTEKGILSAYKLPNGDRRILWANLVDLMQKCGIPLEWLNDNYNYTNIGRFGMYRPKRKRYGNYGTGNVNNIDYPPESLEFMRAVTNYKKDAQAPFPTWYEIWCIFTKELGYSKQENKD